ncbi:MAG: anthranilate synthase component I family protein [Bergeyella sp.]|nr:anthranilate synthase component I family protein [Bergeyella sp.]
MNFPDNINIESSVKEYLSDLYTPVGIYLRLRDKYRDSLLLESAGNQNEENNFSFIAINPIAGIEIKNTEEVEIKFPLRKNEIISLEGKVITDLLHNFAKCFTYNNPGEKIVRQAQGFFGYTSYEAVPFFEKINLKKSSPENKIPIIRYRLYQYVIVINHYNDQLFIIENAVEGLKSHFSKIENIIRQKNAPTFPFQSTEAEKSNLTDAEYLTLVEKAKEHCYRGDVFQLVLSRRFSQKFIGDEFNVYRALRNINPSPYLFFFDYGDYKLMGSSPESQLIIKDNKAIVHPIAGTFKRTGSIEKDLQAAKELKNDPKENAEHTMLVDLARNDLSILGQNTKVTKYKEVHFYSHVLHMVSEVQSEVHENKNPFSWLANTFPQGTLSGAPKYKAMELIDYYEKTSRSFYAGCIGFVGLDGSCNQAIMIRSFLSKNNTLFYQAGAGIVASSKAQKELREVNNKLSALKQAIKKAENLN